MLRSTLPLAQPSPFSCPNPTLSTNQISVCLYSLWGFFQLIFLRPGLWTAQKLAARGILFQTMSSMAISTVQPAGRWLQRARRLWKSPALCLLCTEHWDCSLRPVVRDVGLTVESLAVCSEKAHSLDTHLRMVTWISVLRTERLQGLLVLFYPETVSCKQLLRIPPALSLVPSLSRVILRCCSFSSDPIHLLSCKSEWRWRRVLHPRVWLRIMVLLREVWVWISLYPQVSSSLS